jgi:hypothetical protein
VLDVLLISLLATAGWLMAPITALQLAGEFVASLIFLLSASWLKVFLTRRFERSEVTVWAVTGAASPAGPEPTRAQQ